jgi:hypothetical protein
LRGRFVRAGSAALLLTLACDGAVLGDGDGSAAEGCNMSGGPGCADGATERAAVCTSPSALPSPPCPTGSFLYDDSIGGPNPTGDFTPSDPVGDQLCHHLCETDTDCTDPCRPSCHTLGLFHGGDYNCNLTVRICGTDSADEC